MGKLIFADFSEIVEIWKYVHLKNWKTSNPTAFLFVVNIF